MKLILRDYLAIDRTRLANQRTLLAYIRTAIMIFGTGITFIHIFRTQHILWIIGISLLPVSLLTAIIGLVSFFTTRNKMKNLYNFKIEEQ